MKTNKIPSEGISRTRHGSDLNLNRRCFMKGATAAAVASTGVSLSWTDGASAAQSRGGHMKVAVGGAATTDTLDIGSTGGAHNQSIIESVRSKLVDQLADGSLVPDLATEWGPSDGGKRWTFKLRNGVEFHNGKTVSTQDVIDSINVHRGPETKAAGASLMKIVSNITTDGNDVVFELSEPAADFAYYLGQTIFSICPSKDGVVDQSGVGSGAFVLEQFDPGVRGSGKRNPNYYRDSETYLDSFELLGVNDTTALSNALLAGEVHAIQPV